MKIIRSHDKAIVVLGLATLHMFTGCAMTSENHSETSIETAAHYAAEPATVKPTSTASRVEPLAAEESPSDSVETQWEPGIQPVSFLQDDEAPGRPTRNAGDGDDGRPIAVAPQFEDRSQTLPLDSFPTTEYPIDLPTALRLAGADNLQIAFAAEQVQQALARVDAAEVLWIPSVRFGIGYNNHAGRIQETEGNVIEVARSSLSVGAGFGTGTAPLNGGSGGPARMFVDLSLVDILFEPLAARQAARAAQSDQTATFNDTLLATSFAYLDLVRASSLVAVANEAVANASELARITKDFADSGKGLQADADRAAAELASRRREILRAEEALAVASAELARILRLDPTTQLMPAEAQPVSVQMLRQESTDLQALIDQAHSMRPELARASAVLRETCSRVRQEELRPVLPHVFAGFSGGGFGGSDGSAVSSFSDRTDFDLGVVWEMQNLGFGNRALQAEQRSVHRQARVSYHAIRERIAAEVTQAFEQVRLRNQQIAIAAEQVRSAAQALQLNLDGIRGGELRPIEIQQAIGGLANARREYFDAIIDHNRAQFALLRAIGRPNTGDQ